MGGRKGRRKGRAAGSKIKKIEKGQEGIRERKRKGR